MDVSHACLDVMMQLLALNALPVLPLWMHQVRMPLTQHTVSAWCIAQVGTAIALWLAWRGDNETSSDPSGMLTDGSHTCKLTPLVYVAMLVCVVRNLGLAAACYVYMQGLCYATSSAIALSTIGAFVELMLVIISSSAQTTWFTSLWLFCYAVWLLVNTCDIYIRQVYIDVAQMRHLDHFLDSVALSDVDARVVVVPGPNLLLLHRPDVAESAPSRDEARDAHVEL